jgi:hypothetical protein
MHDARYVLISEDRVLGLADDLAGAVRAARQIIAQGKIAGDCSIWSGGRLLAVARAGGRDGGGVAVIPGDDIS